jgi:hypothetical protein
VVIIYVFGLVSAYIDSYLMRLCDDYSPVPARSRDPMKTIINYCVLHYFRISCVQMNVKTAGALPNKAVYRSALQLVLLKIGTWAGL